MKYKVMIKDALKVEDIEIENDLCNVSDGSYTFKINHQTFRTRLAKKTSKKLGYFCVLWHKDEQNNNIAFSYDDFEDTLIIIVDEEDEQGIFMLTRDKLLELGVLRDAQQKGKMGFRIYTSCTHELNNTAKRMCIDLSQFYHSF